MSPDYKQNKIMENKLLTSEQHEALRPWEKEIRSAHRNSFVRMTGSDFAKVAELYREITGTALTKSQMGCNTCRLNTLRKLGAMYEEYEEREARKASRKSRQRKLDREEGDEQ